MLRNTKKRITLILFLILISAACITAQTQESASYQLKTVVIDPGHGGKDPGCMKGKVYEKDIVLSVALKLGRMIQDSLPGVNVVYTRTDDTFVELSARAGIANRDKADLFISIHINATGSTQAHGTETFIMGMNMSEDNMEVCQLENSVITLESDYSTKYEGFNPSVPESYIIFSLLQNAHMEQSLILAENLQKSYSKGPITHSRGVRQAGFVVLWKCTMPSILTELGFLSNPGDYKILSDSKQHYRLAGNIFNAVKAYRNKFGIKEVQDTAPSSSMAEPIPVYVKDDSKRPSVRTSGDKKREKEPSDTLNAFHIQILATPYNLKNDDPFFKGKKHGTYKVGNINKYYIGDFKTREEAQRKLSEVRRDFKDAFVTFF